MDTETATGYEGQRTGTHRGLMAVLVIAALLRLPLLSSNPVGFGGDEVCIGYDAYSMLKTGRDQYGAFMPLFA